MFCFDQIEEIEPFKEFLSTLKCSITAMHSALEEVNIAQLSDELLELNLVELDNEVNGYKKLKKSKCSWVVIIKIELCSLSEGSSLANIKFKNLSSQN